MNTAWCTKRVNTAWCTKHGLQAIEAKTDVVARPESPERIVACDGQVKPRHGHRLHEHDPHTMTYRVPAGTFDALVTLACGCPAERRVMRAVA